MTIRKRKPQTDFVQAIIGAMQDLTRILWSAAALLAPWLVPVAPASFFGWSLYQTSTDARMPVELAVSVGVVAAIGLETVNIAAAHAAVQLSHRRQEHRWKFVLALFLVAFYVAIGVTSVAMLDAPINTQIVGVAMFLLAPVAITAQALTMDLARVGEQADQEQAKEDAALAWERQQEREEADANRAHRLELARLGWEHRTRVALAGKSPEKAETSPVTLPQSPEWLQKVPGNLAEFRQLVADGSIVLDGMTGDDLAEHIPAVHSSRTGRYWLRHARNGKDS